MQRFDVLTRQLNVFDIHFLQASAGTGKTFSIEHVVIRLLIAEKDPPVLIEEILLVTFTKAATRELKERIFRNLNKTVRMLKEGYSEIDYLNAIFEKGPTYVAAAIIRLEEALICFDQAQIFTVHGFCHRMLSECGFEAGVTLQVTHPDQAIRLSGMTLAIKDFLRIGIKSELYSTSQMKRVLGKFRYDIHALFQRMSSLVNQGSDVDYFPSFQEYYHQWKSVVTQGVLISANKWLSDYALLSSAYKQMGHPAFSEQAARLAVLLEKRDCSSQEFEWFLSQKEFFLEKMEEDNLKARAPPLSQEPLHYPGCFDQLRCKLLPIFQGATDSSQIFLRMVADCRRFTDTVFTHTDQFSPDKLLIQMQDSLRSPAFVESIRKKYRAAIIDEFQDTDPIQWHIFQTLFLHRVEALCLVGDPKQSIYSFRNADVYTYFAAASKVGEKHVKYLDTNFRSTPSLVSALNRLFERKGWMRLPALNIGLDVPPVHPHARCDSSTDFQLTDSVHFFIGSEKGSARSKKWPSESLEHQFFAWMAQEMHRRGSDWGQYTVLVKDRHQAQRLHDFLHMRQIPSVLKRVGALHESVAFYAMVELLEAVCFPSDFSRVAQFLGGPLIGWTADRLCVQEVKAKLIVWQETLFCQGFGPFFQAFLAFCWEGKSIEEQLLSRSDLTLYLHLRQLGEIVIEEEIAHGMAKEEYLLFLKKMQHIPIDEEERLKIRPQEEVGSVLIMTIHMSKGLEFDTVFAYGLVSRQLPFEELLIKKQGKDTIGTLEWEDADCLRALEEVDAEKMRQLYVALTRAKTRVYIPIAIDLGKKPIKLGQAAPIELFLGRLLYPALGEQDLYAAIPQVDVAKMTCFFDQLAISYSFVEAADVPCRWDQKMSASEEVLVEPPLFAPPGKNESVFSFTALAVKRERETLLSPVGHALPLGVETGLIFHRILEQIIRKRLHCPIQNQAIAVLIAEEIQESGLQGFYDMLVDLVIEILQLPLLDFSVAEIPPCDLQPEMEFLYPVEGGMMKGIVDLLFQRDDKYYLLDWKTNYLTEYSQKNLLDAMEKNDYFLQAQLYTEALGRYVKLFDNRPFEECFGGVFYVFVRGKAVLYYEPKTFFFPGSLFCRKSPSYR